MDVKGKNVFSGRNFRLVFFGALVSEVGAMLYNFAVSFYILEISGNNAFLQGLYLAVSGIMLLLFTPIGGVLGDRMNKAKIMYLCDFAKGASIILATVLMFGFKENGAHIAILFANGIVVNIIGGIFNPASGALLPFIVEEDRLQQANSYFSMKNALITVFGIVLAGILYAAMPIEILFIVVGICYLLSGVSEVFIRYESVTKAEKVTLKVIFTDMRDGFIYLKNQKAVIAIVSAVLFINFFLTPVTGNFMPFFTKTDLAAAPSYLLDTLMTPELWYSAFGMLFGLSSLIGSVVLSARPESEKCGLKIARRILYVAGLTVLLMAGYWILVEKAVSLNAFLILFAAGSFLFGLSIVLVNIPMSTALMRIIDKDQLSKVSSIMSIISQGLIPISSVLAGAILQGFGSTALLCFCSVGLTVSAVLLLVNKQAREI